MSEKMTAEKLAIKMRQTLLEMRSLPRTGWFISVLRSAEHDAEERMRLKCAEKARSLLSREDGKLVYAAIQALPLGDEDE